jgi:hypothetical protein
MFELDAEQSKRLNEWCSEQDKKVMESQKGTEVEHSGEAYYGCSGGSVTYMFTPTTLGLVVKVQNNMTGEIIDLTDYESW